MYFNLRKSAAGRVKQRNLDNYLVIYLIDELSCEAIDYFFEKMGPIEIAE